MKRESLAEVLVKWAEACRWLGEEQTEADMIAWTQILIDSGKYQHGGK